MPALKPIRHPDFNLLRFALVLALLCGLWAAAPVQTVRAATLTVTKTADTDDGVCDADCSLREAIANASPGDTITFASGLSGQTITLSLGPLYILQNLAIDGSALSTSVSISGHNAVQVFNINTGVTAALKGLVITAGKDITEPGGGILNGGTLTVTNSTFSGNSSDEGSGIANSGTLTVANSTFSGNISRGTGGGIANVGTLTVTNSTFSGNTAQAAGGGIFNKGSLVYTNTLLADSPGAGDCYTDVPGGGTTGAGSKNNLVRDDSGGFNCGTRGTHYQVGDPLLGALGAYGGSTQTFALLPGSPAIDAGDSATCSSVPVSAKDQRGVARPAACDIGAFESRGFTLSKTGGDNQTTLVSTAFASPLALTVAPVHAGEPVDGGLVTFTAPASGASASFASSPAAATIASGAASAPTLTANATVGAYSVTAAASGASSLSFSLHNNYTAQPVVTKTADTDDGVCDADCSLREAIAAAASGDTATFASGLSSQTITLSLGTLTIAQNLTIDGSALAAPVRISGGGIITQVLLITSGTVTLKGLVITAGNNVGSPGGGIVNFGTLTVDHSTLSGNTTGVDGGGILNGGTLTVTNSTFSGNSASNGGGIYNTGTLTVANSTFSGNSATHNGGGIFSNSAAPLTVTNSTFSGNSATYNGGGMYNVNGATLTYSNTLLADSASGGDCYINAGTINTNSKNNLVRDDSGGFNCGTKGTHYQVGAPLLSALGAYGGSMQTFALLPGSPAIDAGDSATCSSAPVGAKDQRGVARPAACDVGAFESQGFTLSKTGGDNQATLISTAFASPLALSVAPVHAGEPVDGGLVTFTPPASGASASFASSPGTATIASGAASAPTLTANATAGAYSLTAAASGASSLSFSLNNVAAVNSPVVNKSADTFDGVCDTADCSLRDALAAVPDGGTVTFAPGLSGQTITLSNASGFGTLVIDKNLSIDGRELATPVTISGNNTMRVFYIGQGLTVTLAGLTISDGKLVSGGGTGIYNAGTLTLESSTVSNNTSQGQGSGIGNFFNGILTLNNSTITGNSTTSSGGGVYSEGTLRVSNSTFSANSSGTYGGAIASRGTVTLVNSTLSGNTALHGGAVAINGPMSYTNNLLAGSTSGEDCYRINGTVSGKNNLVEKDADPGFTCGLKDTNYVVANPNLGALADNGGLTQTMALQSASPAIGAGDDATCLAASGSPAYGAGGIDQRGMPRRSSSGTCAIGAFEPGTYAFLTVDLGSSIPAGGSVLTGGPASLKVVFNRPVDPVTGSAPANYLLVEAGANQGFNTQTCRAGLAGDDAAVPVNSVAYDDSTFSATLAVNGGTPLPIGLYRLFVCGTTSIHDRVGLKLNNGLSDAPLSFTVGAAGGSSGIPPTGFAPGRVTGLPPQPRDRAYRAEDGMVLEIPSLGVDEPIVGVPQSAGWDVSWLGSRIGYLQGTAFPSLAGNSVLAAHVTDANGQPGPFAGLAKMSYGQTVLLHAWGQTFTYQVRMVKDWVSPSDTRLLTQHESLPWLTLVTCRGFNPKTGAYEWRTLVRAVLVRVVP